MTTRPVTRRTVLGGAAAVGGAVVLAACGSDDDGGDAAPEPGTGAEETEAIDEGEELAEGQDPVDEEILIAAVEVPIGSGVIIGSAGVVVTQPTLNEFKGFSSTCTHQGCQVSSVEGDTIRCACHNSTFSVDDGSVLGGPATAPLPEVPVALAGDQVVSG